MPWAERINLDDHGCSRNSREKRGDIILVDVHPLKDVMQLRKDGELNIIVELLDPSVDVRRCRGGNLAPPIVGYLGSDSVK